MECGRLESGSRVGSGRSREPPRPIKLAGARNGNYSGKVVAGPTKPIRDLQAAATDLKGDGGVIPAANIQIRYGLNNGVEIMEEFEWYRKAWLGLLADKAPAEMGVREGVPDPLPAGGSPRPQRSGRAGMDNGQDAPRRQTGRLYGNFEYPGQGRETMCHRDSALNVLDWTLPDPQAYKTWVELIQSPDTLAVEYKVPLWSERHFELIAKSFKLDERHRLARGRYPRHRPHQPGQR